MKKWVLILCLFGVAVVDGATNVSWTATSEDIVTEGLGAVVMGLPILGLLFGVGVAISVYVAFSRSGRN